MLGLKCRRQLQLSSRLFTLPIAFFSDLQHATIAIPQGGFLNLDLVAVKKIDLKISSAWQDHCDIEYSHNLPLEIDLMNESDGYFSIQALPLTVNGEIPTLKITIPEYFDIDLSVDDALILFSKKVKALNFI
jgi:hypothetical protein